MRSTLLIACLLAFGCSTQESPSSSTKTSSAPKASATATAADQAAKSPLHVVLQSKSEITLAGVVDGVWISEGPGKRVAKAKAGEELTAGPSPEGLPTEWARLLHASGYLNRLWISLELAEKGASTLPKTPLYRFDGKEFRRIAEDWRPLITIWSQDRSLAVWSSAGKLKAKVPLQTPEIPGDVPGSNLDDERCPYNLRLDLLAGLSTGEVFGLGSCSPSGAKGKRSVVVQWPLDEEAGDDPTAELAATAKPTATAAAPTAAPSAAPSVSASASAAPSASAGAAAAPTAAPAPTAAAAAPPDPGAQDADEATGVRGHVMVLPGPERALSHRSLIALSATDVLVAGVDLESTPKPKSYLWRFDGTSWNSIELPSPEPLRAVAQTADGTLWLATDHGLWTKGKGAWQSVAPPREGSADAKWTYLSLFALGDTVWISAEMGTGGHVVLRTKPATKQITW